MVTRTIENRINKVIRSIDIDIDVKLDMSPTAHFKSIFACTFVNFQGFIIFCISCKIYYFIIRT